MAVTEINCGNRAHDSSELASATSYRPPILPGASETRFHKQRTQGIHPSQHLGPGYSKFSQLHHCKESHFLAFREHHVQLAFKSL